MNRLHVQRYRLSPTPHQVAAHLGLDSCRTLPKRAIQFGTRIAQHCARHTHGSHRRGKGSDPAFFDSNGD